MIVSSSHTHKYVYEMTSLFGLIIAMDFNRAENAAAVKQVHRKLIRTFVLFQQMNHTGTSVLDYMEVKGYTSKIT